ncbi:sugar-binding transcriptional regulator [Herbiconiux sp. L3-i23]|uniref:sugar-binding transcriptional regulator n=1 Tax=Herbiconiux sp. L3-i23 TaxID=2905871 RepID=UPI00204D1266|nr:sugar-binding transcriptional regulator [Herbiconiux sp. L3-i23]BDI21553.1 DNA-binding transcriptional regulator [Herbiconiux sp. L3-i23]
MTDTVVIAGRRSGVDVAGAMGVLSRGSRLPPERMALLVKVARMYHEQGLRQPEIAERLHISQSRASRLLKEAVALGIVRTIVVPPPGVYPELEDAVRDRYGLSDMVVADAGGADDNSLIAALGAAGAAYLETTLSASDHVGISSWSATLIAAVEAMTPRPARSAAKIVQLLGGVGAPQVQVQATRLTERFAAATGAEPVFFPAPGIVASDAARDAILSDPYIASVADEWNHLTVALVGIGTLSPSPLLAVSGNAVPDEIVSRLRDLGAVGDVCLRYFDADGEYVASELGERVLGMTASALRAVPRRVGIAGGERKHEAIRAALRGKWVDVLITDHATAERLAADEA